MHWHPVHLTRQRLLGVHWKPVHLRAVAVPRSQGQNRKQARISTPWVRLWSRQEVAEVKELEADKQLEGLQLHWSKRPP